MRWQFNFNLIAWKAKFSNRIPPTLASKSNASSSSVISSGTNYIEMLKFDFAILKIAKCRIQWCHRDWDIHSSRPPCYHSSNINYHLRIGTSLMRHGKNRAWVQWNGTFWLPLASKWWGWLWPCVAHLWANSAPQLLLAGEKGKVA